MKSMTYKGYAARIEYSDEDGCFVGHIAGINDIVGFHGASGGKLRAQTELTQLSTWRRIEASG